ncbi:MAG: DUF2281 domain-containing protein [Microcystis sp. M038S2]|jgi:hypothetical protein|uniref:DUF2281 domain-containing protein n=1 Tax=Microcystis aeruginosa G11-04 TaxID=2685956 RepID=A0A966L3Z2_MICAE|nr:MULTISPECIES: hypothetical protein [unclassified Microcystis]NCS38029.1 DUF2281 domain-containing protein [Microcystis aeruginosa BS13-10]NCS50200.1 DUF2281 domain-containing protein [Microcystis aeruginosa BK11-02]NCS56270.1 DUF2281 domain-containing protein [Microcystis aeruginosa G11-04]NCT43828.1 DUF2281 domain-containing protein [Microcystis aeruginosa G11-09]TRU58213.1 MAG: DUF2281 domain-containing protein [Microcystis aeruginosa Ma_QC_C_20070823_S13D]TRU63922.1 MAG: DUF2281 domain-
MTQATTHSQTILEKLQTLTPQQQQSVIDFIEFLQFKAEKTEITEEEEPISFYEAAKEYIGCVDGGPGDLATNKDYLRGIGSK